MAAPGVDSYKEVILFLITAGIVVPLFHRVRISPVLGFLGAGVLLGPFGLGRLTGEVPWLSTFTIARREEIAHVAEFGVVFLMFTIGLELTWERLRRLRRLVFGLGTLQVVVCSAAIAGVAAALGAGPVAAGVIGVALALSSTAIVVPELAAQKRLNTPTGRASFSVLLFQDLAVAPILFTVTALGGRATERPLLALGLALVQAASATVVLVFAGRLVLRPLFHHVAATRSPELFMAGCLLVIVTTSVVAAGSGLPMTLGAFVAGLLLAETEYRRAIEAMIEPFKGLLLGVFFVSVGMALDPVQFLQQPGLVVGLALGLVALKALLIFGLGLLWRLPKAVAAEAGLLLGPGGEFAFVVIGAATAVGLVGPPFGEGALVLATVTMFLIPPLARLARGAGRQIARAGPAAQESEAPPAGEGRVVIAGFGRVGRLVGEMLARHGVPYVAVDADPARVREQRALGLPVYFGDSTNPELLRRCGVEGARALVVTLDAPRTVEAVVAAARAERPDITIVARARDARHATALYALGVDDAVPETIEASLQLSEAVLVDIGVPMGIVIASIHERRDEFRKLLQPKKAEEPAAQGERSAGQFMARRTVGKPGA